MLIGSPITRPRPSAIPWLQLFVAFCVELLVFRIIQEAINNARRHAEASKIEVCVEFNEGKMVATVRDNGKGFELPRTLGELSRSGKLGLIGAEERARLLDGSLTVQSEPNKGTTVVIEAPI